MKNNGFSQSELQEFEESFALFDTERVGSISAVELRAILESLQDRRNMPHLDKLLKELATCSEEDRLEFDDYVALMESTSLNQTLQKEESYETANFSHVFQLFDVEQKGYISIQDLERAATELGEYDITQDELEEMIERAQSSHQGRVYLPEFSRIMNLNLFHKLEQDASVA
jgi:Ca2+-binding EF-hand superfamily protein